MHLENRLLLEIVKQYTTPLYVYNGNLIRQRYRELYSLIPYPKLQIFYAMKANYNPGILHLLAKEGASIDAVSPGDCILALKCGFTPDRILYTANNFTNEEMDIVAKLGITFNIGSLSELLRYGGKYPNTRICLRFNPAVVAGAHKHIQTGGELTKFGILLDDVHQVLEITKKHNLHVVGLHEHTGSGIKDTERFLEAINNTLALARAEYFPELEFVDFGGGFGVPYHPDEERVDYPRFGKEISKIVTAASKNYGRQLKLYFEPGKYIVCEAGYLVVQVNTIKNNNGRLIVGTNSGFPQLIRPMLYDAYHHIVNISNPDGDPKIYDICGNICETGDRFAMDRELPEIRETDFLSIQNAGAYCYAMGGIYNMRAMPPEVLIDGDSATLIRRGLTEEGLVNQILSECNL